MRNFPCLSLDHLVSVCQLVSSLVQNDYVFINIKYIYKAMMETTTYIYMKEE